tara:strand:- start:13358 stop:15787 length:2430 start_codon:yes stop_codon:yes gene_type:complete
MFRYVVGILFLLSFTACKDEAAAPGSIIPVTTEQSISIENGADSYYFGQKNINSTTSVELTIRNPSTLLVDDLSIGAIAGTYAFAGGSYPGDNGNCGSTLFSGQSCKVEIVFQPSGVSYYTEDLDITYTIGGKSSSASFQLRGYGALLAELSISDGPTYNYGSISSGSVIEHTFTIENEGFQAATGLSAASINLPFNYKGGSYPGLGGNCGTSLGASSTCSIVVEFSPTADGIYSSNLSLEYNNGVENLSESIELSGIASSITPPDAVLDLAVDSTTQTTAILSWSAPNDNGTSIVDYEIDYKLSVSSSWTTFSDGISASTGATVTGLNHSTDYDFRVRAINGSYSNFSNMASGTTLSSADAINNLSITNAGPYQITLGWSAPNDNGTPISDYIVEYKLSSGGSWTVFTDGVSSELTATITGLSEATSYDFRVQSFNGVNSAYSNIATGETTVDDPFFDPSVYKAMNLNGATNSAVVAFEDTTNIELNGSVLTSLNAGETYAFSSSQNDVISADKPIFVAGRRATGSGASREGNMVWSSPSWAGKNFAFTATRSNPHQVTVYAFESAFVEVKQDTTTVASQSLSADSAHTFSINALGSFTIESDGLIIAAMYSAGSSEIVDPKPLLPASTDIIGIPSESLKLGTLLGSNNYSVYHSDSTTDTGSLSAGTEISINPTGSPTNQYQANSLRVIAQTGVVGNSNADSDGLCSAPFVPVAMMKKRFAINVVAEWVAFASIEAGDITVIDPGGGTSTVSLVKSGSEANAPYKARLTNVSAGTRFESSIKFQTWYEPDTNTNAADDDETVLFGFD